MPWRPGSNPEEEKEKLKFFVTVCVRATGGSLAPVGHRSRVDPDHSQSRCRDGGWRCGERSFGAAATPAAVKERYDVAYLHDGLGLPPSANPVAQLRGLRR